MSQYKKVVVVGATSGIGAALAERFVANNAFVIVTGRRKDTLADFVQRHGHDKAQAVPYDITRLDAADAFAGNIMQTHPDVDCVVINAGVQRGFDFSEPGSVDMDAVALEVTTNYLGPLALTKAFLPHLTATATTTEGKRSLVYTTSGLAIVPMPRCPNYCATKAALHQFLLSLRWQLRDTGVRVVELLPPAVQTELHDAKHQPDIKDGRSIGMPLDEFTDQAWKGLSSEEVEIAVGMAKSAYDKVEPARQELFKGMLERTGAK